MSDDNQTFQEPTTVETPEAQREAEQTQEQTTQEKQRTEQDMNQEIDDAKSNGASKEQVREMEEMRDRIKQLNKENEKRRKQIGDWDALVEKGYDVDKIQEMIQEQEASRRKKMEEEERWQELFQELKSEKETELGRVQRQAEEQLTSMKSTLEKHLVDKTIAETLGEEGVRSPKLLSRYMKDFVRTVEDDGEYKTVVMDEKGEVRTKRGGAFFTVSDLINEMKQSDDFAHEFPAPSVSGAGTSVGASDKSSSGKQPINAKPRSKMTSKEKSDFQRQHGFDEYFKLPLN